MEEQNANPEAQTEKSQTEINDNQEAVDDKKVENNKKLENDKKVEGGKKKESGPKKKDDSKKETVESGAPGLDKKKKKESKNRQVDMEQFYPEESVSTTDIVKVEEVPKKKKEMDPMADRGVDFDVGKFSEPIIDVTKDYEKVDPSFLEFFTSKEELADVIDDVESSAKIHALEEVEEEEEEEFQQEIFVEPPEREHSDRVYDQICDLETPISTDESFSIPKFKYIKRRRKYSRNAGILEQDKWFAKTPSDKSIEISSNVMRNLKELIAPALKDTLKEIAIYQPPNPVYYMTYSLLHRTKPLEELDLDPDPHLIQVIVDKLKKKKKPTLKKPEVTLDPCGESQTFLPPKSRSVQIHSSEDEDPSHIRKIQRKYKKALKQVVAEEKEQRSNFDRRTMRPGTCLGPTTLPLPNEPITKEKPKHE